MCIFFMCFLFKFTARVQYSENAKGKFRRRDMITPHPKENTAIPDPSLTTPMTFSRSEMQ